MDAFSIEFLLALGSIILIDLVLAGDNALVIALTARNLPFDEQRKVVFWGTVGAIAIRTVMTLVAVWLLTIPGILFIGGLVLIWIAIKLMTQSNSEQSHLSSLTFWGAMKTIVIADAVMGIDNVLGVAGAAHGSFLLVVLGLLISVPIMVWCSNLILKLVDRLPVIIEFGTIVLAWTGVSMMFEESFVESHFPVNLKWQAGIEIFLALLVWAFARYRRSRKLK